MPFNAPASSALGLYLQQAVLSLLATRPVAQAHKLPMSAVQVSALVTQGDAVVQAVPIFATETSHLYRWCSSNIILIMLGKR